MARCVPKMAILPLGDLVESQPTKVVFFFTCLMHYGVHNSPTCRLDITLLTTCRERAICVSQFSLGKIEGKSSPCQACRPVATTPSRLSSPPSPLNRPSTWVLNLTFYGPCVFKTFGERGGLEERLNATG